jgi:hypothetical protein
MKIYAEICVHKPENAHKVVEALIAKNCAVVIRGSAYPREPAIFVAGFGETDVDDDGYDDGHDYFESLLDETGGRIMEAGERHPDTAMVPWVELPFAIDVVDDQCIAHRISCLEYSPERAFKMAIEAAGLLSRATPQSLGNALARRMLLMALGGRAGAGSEADDLLKTAAAAA